MIRMPQRSVTRFFIPLIDVMMLLFVIFLLMPIANEEELQKSQDSSKNLGEDVDYLEREIEALREKLKLYARLEPKLDQLRKLEDELESLKNLNRKSLQRPRRVHDRRRRSQDRRASTGSTSRTRRTRSGRSRRRRR